jgi:hypothetical protein
MTYFIARYAASKKTGRLQQGFGFALLLCAATLFSVPAAHAQILYGSLTGTITDASNAVIPNVTVELTNQATGTGRTVTSDSHGDYLVRNMEPGPYTITIKHPGFAAFTQRNVLISVNQDQRVNITLQLGNVQQQVTIDTTPPALQTESAEVSHYISSAQIAELPVTSSQGRNFQALYTLIPGAAAVTEQNSTASNPSRAMSVNVNGVEFMSNTTRIDGAVNTYGWLPYLIAYVPPADSIQTVNFVTNSFNAEQGVAGGAAVNVIIKGGTNQFHGSVWLYNQLFNTNARPYTATPQAIPRVPKNIFNQFGFSIGGPVYIPKILTGKKKLFFFQDFERTTRRQLITGTQTVPTTAMLGGDFSAVASGLSQAANTILYDPQPGGIPVTNPTTAVAGYLLPQYRTVTFMSEYGCNCIPASRQFPGSTKMLALLQPISAVIGTPTTQQLSAQLANLYNGSGTFSYDRNTSDSKVTYNPSDSTSIFGRYSIEPFSVTDPQELGQAGGGTFDGGQPGAASGRIQNVGLGFTHVINPRMVLDADFGYTRQVTGAQSLIDISVGNFGLNTLGIPGTNGPGINYAGQPSLMFGNTGANTFSSLGNASGANPFLFRDNQFTTDVNLSWTTGRHATKYGFTWYHFDLNHFQPTSGSDINAPRGGFRFQGGMTTGPGNLSASGAPNNINAYTSLADFLLGLPNNGTGAAVAKPSQLTNPNAMRWTQYAAYAQDQWTVTPKVTLNYGVRYEMYPAPYRDHTGVYRLDPTLPQTANVVIGGVNGNPRSAGIDMGWGMFVPRVGIAYRATERMVIRSGAGLTSDPVSLRFLRDSFPIDLAPSFSGTAANTIAVDPSQKSATNPVGLPLPLSVGIPASPIPDISSGFASLPVSGGTNTVAANYRRGYIVSWNLFVEQDLGNRFIANIGYVGTRQVRQLGGYTLNAAPLPSSSTICMPNGQYNPSSGLSGPCNFQANTLINTSHCNLSTGYTCYNTGGITMNQPMWSSNYNGLQAQLTRNAGRLAQFGLVYTWSHAFNYQDNGAGSGSTGLSFSYPAYFYLNRATASYDRTNNLQFWGIYHLPFGNGQKLANQGLASAIFGGFQLNGQISHTSGAPFSVSPSTSSANSPGNTQYADLIAPYRQLGGHNRTPGNNSVSGGLAWFDTSVFANPTGPRFGTTHRNQFRGPGVTNVNASVVRGFHIYRESEFQVRVEAFNLLNHPQLTTNPNATIGGGTFGYITTFGNTRSLQFSGRFNF